MRVFAWIERPVPSGEEPSEEEVVGKKCEQRESHGWMIVRRHRGKHRPSANLPRPPVTPVTTASSLRRPALTHRILQSPNQSKRAREGGGRTTLPSFFGMRGGRGYPSLLLVLFYFETKRPVKAFGPPLPSVGRGGREEGEHPKAADFNSSNLTISEPVNHICAPPPSAPPPSPREGENDARRHREGGESQESRVM